MPVDYMRSHSWNGTGFGSSEACGHMHVEEGWDASIAPTVSQGP